MRANARKGNPTEYVVKSSLILSVIFAMILVLADLSTVIAGAIPLKWDAVTGYGVTGYKVYYKADSAGEPYNGTGAAEGASPIDVHNLTSTTINGLDPNKAYYFTITAYDAAGNESAYSDVVTVLESVSPTISISSPTNGATVSASTSVTATAGDNQAVTKVEFYVNGILQATDSSSPYIFAWNTTSVTDGTYALSAKAYDAAGNVGISSNLSVTVNNRAPDTIAPTVSVTSPSNNASVNGTVSVAANASDASGVTRVDFYLNGTLRASVNTTPYNFAWDTTSVANGSYTLTAKAYDATGNVGSSSNVSVNVNNPLQDTSAPVVTAFALPATTTSLTVAVSTFTATDNVGVNGYLISESATAPGVSTSGWSATVPTTYTFWGSGSRTAYGWARDAAGNVSLSRSAAVNISLPDSTAPVVSAFTLLSIATSLTVPVNSFSATDNVSVTGYLISESATAPAASASGWSATALISFTFSAAGSKTAYAWAKDAAGNVSLSRSAAVTITLLDVTAPTVSTFSMPATATSLTVAVSTFTATDNVGVTGYLIGESATKPAATAAGWSATVPTSFTFIANGNKTAYAWAKDAAGNVSSSRSASVTITLPDTTAPVVSAFTMPITATSLTVPVSSFTATDNVGVNGYLVTESATKPSASATGWSASAPTSFTFSAAGSKTAYGWARDAAGNVSLSRSAAVNISLPDSTAPVVSAFTLPTTATSLTMMVSSFTATDNVGVSGYLISESATAPAASASGWSATALVSFTFSAAGSKTAYAWAKDAAGNVSAGFTATVTITVTTPTPVPYTISDALLALRITVGMVIPTPAQLARTDVSPVDGKTDISDALSILRDVVGLKKVVL